jgi:hypothetical protein
MIKNNDETIKMVLDQGYTAIDWFEFNVFKQWNSIVGGITKQAITYKTFF